MSPPPHPSIPWRRCQPSRSHLTPPCCNHNRLRLQGLLCRWSLLPPVMAHALASPAPSAEGGSPVGPTRRLGSTFQLCWVHNCDAWWGHTTEGSCLIINFVPYQIKHVDRRGCRCQSLNMFPTYWLRRKGNFQEFIASCSKMKSANRIGFNYFQNIVTEHIEKFNATLHTCCDDCKN